MKSISIHQVLDYTGIQSVVLVNDMAPLSVVPSETENVEIFLELKSNREMEEIELEQYIRSNFDNGKLSIELESIDELRDHSIRKLELTLSIPTEVSLEIENENMPLKLNNLKGKLVLENDNAPVAISNHIGNIKITDDNGPIRLQNCIGNLEISLDNGPLACETVSGDQILIESDNGPIRIRNAQFTKVNVTNDNGVIYYESQPIENGDFSFENENGIVNLVLPLNFDFEMEVETENGSVKCKLDAEMIHEGDIIRIRNGEGNTKIRVKTENGTIKLSSDAVINLDFLKQKLDQLKQAINNSKSFEDKEEVQKHLNNIIDYINKNLNSINEDKIRDAVKQAMDKLKSVVLSFEVNEAKGKVVESVEEIGSSIYKELSDVLKQIKDKIEQDFPREKIKTHFQGYMGNFFDKDQLNKMLEPLKKMKNIHFDLNDQEKQEVGERSRLKILEMLESGKISAEDAERLLKAINKE